MSKFKLLNLQVISVKLKATSFDQNSTEDIKTKSFAVKCLSSDPEDKQFGIQFNIELESGDKDFNLSVIAIAHFDTDEPITKEFLSSDFIRINAPAIGYPYLRSFISNLTLNSGYNPVILPTFNFVAMEANRKKRLSTQKEKLEKARLLKE